MVETNKVRYLDLIYDTHTSQWHLAMSDEFEREDAMSYEIFTYIYAVCITQTRVRNQFRNQDTTLYRLRGSVITPAHHISDVMHLIATGQLVLTVPQRLYLHSILQGADDDDRDLKKQIPDVLADLSEADIAEALL